MRIIGLWGAGICCLAVALSAGGVDAQAATLTVQATDVIYAAGTQSALAAQYGGTIPQAVINLPAGATGVYFTSVTASMACFSGLGCLDLAGNNSEFVNDPDGASRSRYSFYGGGAGSISGIAGPGIGFLVGVFLAPGGPSGPMPPMLDYSRQLKESRKVGIPRLDQVFFVGDGLTGDGTGTRQVAKIPKGASQLVLGVADAPNFDSSSPGDYGDNHGTYTITYGIGTAEK